MGIKIKTRINGRFGKYKILEMVNLVIEALVLLIFVEIITRKILLYLLCNDSNIFRE